MDAKEKLDLSDLLTLQETAKVLGVSPRTISRYLREGEFPHAKRIGRRVRIPASDVKAFIYGKVGEYMLKATAREKAKAEAERNKKWQAQQGKT